MATDTLTLELHTPNAHKFWSATLDGSVVTTTGGDAGAKGRTQRKDYGDEAKAREAFDKAVRRKRNEGYCAEGEPWPLPVETADGEVADTLRVVALPKDKESVRSRLRGDPPPHLAMHRKEFGWAFFDGPNQSHLWFPRRLHVGRGHFIRPVDPPLAGSSHKEFPFMYADGGWPFRPDGDGVLVAHHGVLYDVDVPSATAERLHAFDDVATLRTAGVFLYAPDGRDVLWRDPLAKNVLVRLRRDAGDVVPWIEADGPILKAARLADGTLAVQTEDAFLRYADRDGRPERLNRINVRKGWGLGTWLDGRIVIILTRTNAEQRTFNYALHDGGLHLIAASGRKLRWAGDVRGAQWMIECAPGGDVDWTGYRVFNAEAAWRKAAEAPPVPAEHVLERPSLHDAIAQGRTVEGVAPVERALRLGADIERRDYNDRYPPLAYAAWLCDRVDLVELLLAHGAALESHSKTGRTALAAALERGHRAVAARLVEAGAAGSHPRTVEVEGAEVRTHAPIAAAAAAGAYDIVDALLARGADPSATSADGYTPAALAAFAAHDELADRLVAAGGRIRSPVPEDPSPLAKLCGTPRRVEAHLDELREDIAGKPGRSALHTYLAEEWLHGQPREQVSFLLDHGAFDPTPGGLDHGIGAGNVRAVRASLAGGADPNGTYITHNAPNRMLHRALCSKRPSLKVVEALLDAGAEIDARDAKGISALRYAIARLDETFVRHLLDRGASVARGEANWGPLHEAAWQGKADAVALLLARGAEVDETTGDGRTALGLAAQNGKGEVFDLLMARGADPNGGTLPPLFCAALKDNVAAATRLLDAGADLGVKVVNPWNKDATEPLTAQQHAERAKATAVVALLAERGGGGFTTLHAAARANDLEALAALLDAGADIDEAEPDRGNTPLHLASTPDAIRLLLERGASVDKADRYGNTALMVHVCTADAEGAIAKIDALIDGGADVAGATKGGEGALHRAAAWKNLAVARHLIDRGVPVENRTKKGIQPLHVAARLDLVELAELLLAEGARVSPWCFNIHGGEDTPLHVAADNGAVRVAELLMRHGADPGAHDDNEDNYDGGRYTPIHYAASNGDFDMLCVLLRDPARRGLYTPLRGRYPKELAEDHPRAQELIRAVADKETVDAFLARKAAERGETLEIDAEGRFWVERVDEQPPDGTGLAPEAVKAAMGRRDWVRTAPGQSSSLVLRLERGLYRAAVGDEGGIHELALPIRGHSLHYHAGPDDGHFLLSDGASVYFVDAAARTACEVLHPDALGGPVQGVGRTALGVIVHTKGALTHFRWSPGAAAERLWRLPAEHLTGCFSVGTSLVGLGIKGSVFETVWAVAGEDGLRLHSRMHERLVLVWSHRAGDGYEAVAYTSWNPPVKVLRLHHIDGAEASGAPVEAVPGPNALDGVPRAPY